MANAYVNKVNLADGTTLIDISSDTVTAYKLMQGYTAHDRTGAVITGLIVDGDNLGYGLSLVGSAIVGSSVVN